MLCYRRHVWMLLLLVTPAAARAQEPSGLAVAAALEGALVDAIARSEPSVVAIARVRRPTEDETFKLEFRPDPFGRQPLGPVAPSPTDPDFIPNQYGTGVVIDRRGLILTAYHLLAEQCDYYVTTHRRKVYRAEVKAADPRSDLAVLQIEATDLEPIAFGDGDALKKGQLVLTLGNPHAIARDGQVCAGWGIVSNLGRKAPPISTDAGISDKPTLHHYGTLVQIDARLNLGVSGGPLLNLDGRMVGLCVALAAKAGYEQAAGYAIPVDATFRRAVDRLKDGREVEYGFLGVQPENLDAKEVLAGSQGVRVRQVVRGTPADEAGLTRDDIITAVNREPIHDSDALVREVGRLPVEAVAEVALVRRGRNRTVDVTLTKYPVAGKKMITNPEPAWRGMRVDYSTAWVDPSRPSRPRLGFYGAGVVVTEVEQGSPAWQSGLRHGMLITEVGRTEVRTPKQFHAAVDQQRGPVVVHLGDGADPAVRVVP